LRLDAAAQQEHSPTLDNETPCDEFRTWKKDKTAAGANLKAHFIRQDQAHSHFGPTQSTETDAFRELMLDGVVSMNRRIVIGHGI
jgi:hypothetical protein